MWVNVLCVCTGNIFRSVMAEAFLGAIARDRHLDIAVASAGTLDGGRPASPSALQVIGADGLDMSAHRSRRLDAQMIARADLVLGMAREHVRETVLIDPGAWPRSFTIKELVRRGEQVGPRPEGELLSAWLDAVGAGRERDELMGWSSVDDVEDPIAAGPEELWAVRETIREHVQRLVALVEPQR